MAHKIAELRAKTEVELIHEHDRHTRRHEETPFEIRQELARRDAHDQGERMLALARAIAWLTVVITALTVVNVGLVAVWILST